jgi:hypothetical protein
MSLHKFAEQVASQGRGDDSLLVHMTPDEVRNLQQFAQANGTTLTINPTTGLPEAGLLSDLFKSIAPIALGAFLGPAGLGMSSMMAGLTTGGITTLATGSLSRGLMAGLGAYGGSGLGESLMTAGGGMSAANAATTAQQQLSGANLALGEAMPAQAAEQFTKDAVTRMTPSGAVSAGFNKAIASPTAALDFAKSNMGNLAYAAAPIAAGLMVPTTTKLPDPTNTGLIRQMAYNINPDTGMPDPLYGKREMTPIKASEFGDKTFKGQRDLFYQQNPNPYQNPYQLGVGSLNQPPLQQPARMKTGGIVALAGGGVPGYALGGAPKVFTDEELYQQTGDWNKAATLRDAQNVAVSQYNATNNPTVGANINQWIVDNPFATAEDINKAITSVGLTQDIVNPYLTANTNISDATRYALSHATEMPGAGGLAGMQSNILKGFATPNLTQAQIDAQQDLYKLSDADIQSPLTHGFQVADTDIAKAQNYLNTNPDVMAWVNSAEGKDYIRQHPEFDASDIAFTHYQRYGKNEGRKFEEAPAAVNTVVGGAGNDVITSVVPGGTQLPGATVYDNGAFGNYGSGPATGVDYRGNTVSIATPGDIITNPDQTRTVVPNVPGRPYGGFTGIDQLKSAYTAGGGSLGYTSPVVKTPAEHEAAYNKLTDDSLDAYNFLMGKGKNLTQRTATAGRPVMRRYDEAVLGRKIPRPTAKPAGTGTTVIGTPGQPQTYFDEKAYLAANPSVADELRTGKSASGQPVQYTSGYEHWLRYGKAQGWPFPGDYAGYLTAAALANSAGAGGGDGNTSANPSNSTPVSMDSNVANSITGLAAPANPSISVSDMGTVSPGTAAAAAAAADGNTGSTTGTEGGGVASARGGLLPRGYAMGGGLGSLGSYSDGGRLLKGPGDGVSDSIPATIGQKRQPARLADGEFVIPARIVSELGNGSTEAGAKKLYAMMDRVQRARGKTTGKNKIAANSRSDKYLPA